MGEEQVPPATLGFADLGELMRSTSKSTPELVLAPEIIGPKIHVVRNQKVMFDFDIAELFGVQTKVLNQAVKRNMERFPLDFMFQLSPEEFENWRSQIVTSNFGTKMGLRRAPFAFTEHGVTMAATVLKSTRAIEMSLRIVRTFIQLRQMISANRDLSIRIERVERVQSTQSSVIDLLFDEIEALKLPVDVKKRPIGFPQAMTATGSAT